MFANQPPQAPMFASKNQSKRTFVIKSSPNLRSGWVNAHDPKATLFHFIDSADQVLHTNDGHICGCPRRRLNHGCSKSRRMPFGNDNTRSTACLSRSYDRAKVMWIFDTIQYNDQRFLR